MFDLDIWTFVFQIANFVILLIGLRFLLFKPLRGMIEERARELAELRAEARDHEARAADLHNQWQERMEKAESEADGVRQSALRDANAQAEEIIGETRRRAGHLAEQLNQELHEQHNRLVVEQYDDLMDTIMDVAANVVRSVTTRRTHDDLVTNFCANMYQTPPEVVDEYRAKLVDRAPTAYVTTPVALSSEQLKAVTEALSAVMDKRVDVQVQVAPELIAGLQVRMADKLTDNSVRQQLTGIRENARQELLAHVEAE
jgi:F-type H+-transporting ATPase subunit b